MNDVQLVVDRVVGMNGLLLIKVEVAALLLSPSFALEGIIKKVGRDGGREKWKIHTPWKEKKKLTAFIDSEVSDFWWLLFGTSCDYPFN